MSNNRQSVQRLVSISLLVTMAAVLHIFEGLLPALPVPGARLGLANIITLVAIILYGAGSGLTVSVGRIALALAISFNITGFAMSLVGGLLSWLAMFLLVKYLAKHFNLVGISLAGAVAHNCGQLAAASFVLQDAVVFSFLPMLLIFAIPTGIMVGLAAGHLVKALRKLPYFRL